MSSGLPFPDPRQTGKNGVDQVAETQFLIRPRLVLALHQIQIAGETGALLGIEDSTYGEYWESRFGLQFFDMGTMVRLGTAIEVGLRHYFNESCSNAAVSVPSTPVGVFQSLVRPDRIAALFVDNLGVDLAENPAWQAMRELMAHRHLYAHRWGFVDERYIRDIRDLTGIDIGPRLAAKGFPGEEVCWFEPLKRLSGMIEDSRKFFERLDPRPQV